MERVKIELKYTFSCSPKDLFLVLTQPDYMQNWIADRVDYDHRTGWYTFWWGESRESARIVERQNNRYLKWGWQGDSHVEGEFVTFRIVVTPGDELIDLHIVDYCDADETRILRDGWNEQMERLELLL